MKRYSVFGWWLQPKYKELCMIDDKVAIRTFDNNQCFAGMIRTDGLGYIDSVHSVLFDKNGAARLSKGMLSDTAIAFEKTYLSRDDAISYVAHKRDDGCWHGRFFGQLVGEGLTKFVLTELPEAVLAPELKAEPFRLA